jgi:putative oxidoreductase
MLNRINQLILSVIHRFKAAESLPLLIIRVMLGAFFMKSGFGKTFTEAGHQQMVNIVTQSGIPFPEINAYMASATEFFGGLLLAAGLFTLISAFMLASVMLVALLTNFIGDMPTDSLLSASNYLVYTPEFLYVALFVLIMFVGPGAFSVDQILFNKTSGLPSGKSVPI